MSAFTMESFTLGPTPAEEPCEQLGPNYSPSRARAECRAYIAQLRRQFGEEPEGAHLSIKANPHDFGTYLEVAINFDPSNNRALSYARRLEEEAPGEWDAEARKEDVIRGNPRLMDNHPPYQEENN